MVHPGVWHTRLGAPQGGFLGSLNGVWVNKQGSPGYSRMCFATIKGQQRESTERWYWTMSVECQTAPLTCTQTQIHFPCPIP